MPSAWLLSLVSLGAVTGFSFTPPPTPTPPTAQAASPVPDGAAAPADIPAYPVASDPPYPDDRFWLSAEYLLWKVQGQNVPTLVGTLAPQDAELVRQLPNAALTPLFGGSSIPYDPQSGFRVGGGAFFDDGRSLGLEASYFLLGQARQRFDFASDGGAPLGPFFHDPAAGQDVVIMEAVPGLRTGSVAVEVSNRLWGTEANFRARLGALPFTSLHLLAGFRYLQFNEGLSILGSSRLIPGGHLPCG